MDDERMRDRDFVVGMTSFIIGFSIAFYVMLTNLSDVRNALNISQEKYYREVAFNHMLSNDMSEANWTIENQRREIQNLLEVIDKQNKYFISEISLSKELQEFLYDECLKYENVTYEEALAVMMTENPSFNTKALNYNDNGTVDTGLFQINTVNINWLKDLGITDLKDPYQNITAGVYILNSLKYEGHQKYMSYNMGEAGARKKINSGIYSTGYSNKVINTIDEIKELSLKNNLT